VNAVDVLGRFRKHGDKRRRTAQGHPHHNQRRPQRVHPACRLRINEQVTRLESHGPGFKVILSQPESHAREIPPQAHSPRDPRLPPR